LTLFYLFMFYELVWKKKEDRAWHITSDRFLNIFFEFYNYWPSIISAIIYSILLNAPMLVTFKLTL